MNIAIVGYGKMGHAIERAALTRGHRIVCTIDAGEEAKWDSEALASADVVIEFTTPATAKNNILRAWEKGKPVVSGTTGWSVEPLKTGLDKQALVWSSNYSLGVNILFAVNQYLSSLMTRFGGYTPSIIETHHVHKLDKPSGTAKSLSEQIGGEVPIESVREGENPGRHVVSWDSEADYIQLVHQAKGRDGFALGAVMAAEWIIGKTGFHTMAEVLALK